MELCNRHSYFAAGQNCVKIGGTLQFVDTVTWTVASGLIDQDVEVLPGAHVVIDSLHNNDTLKIAPGVRIYVRPGGRLDIAGMKLVPCDTNSWGGIIVEGDNSAQQSDTTAQGRLNMWKCGIANAEDGIQVGYDPNIIVGKGGGIVNLQYTAFSNCKYHLEFWDYRDPVQPYAIKNKSVLEHLNFSWNEQNMPLDFFRVPGDTVHKRCYTQLGLHEVYGIEIKGSWFVNTIPGIRWGAWEDNGTYYPWLRTDSMARGAGIASYNSSFHVRNSGPCVAGYSTGSQYTGSESNGDCFVCVGRTCYFEGFSKAIAILKSDVNQHIDITGAEFVNNITFIHAADQNLSVINPATVNNIFINRCNFKIWATGVGSGTKGFYYYMPGRRHYGISLALPKNYIISDNVFDFKYTVGHPHIPGYSTIAACTNKDEWDFAIKADDGDNGLIQHNSFDIELHVACLEYFCGIKFGGRNTNTTVKCNYFNQRYETSSMLGTNYDIFFHPRIGPFKDNDGYNDSYLATALNGIGFFNGNFGDLNNGVKNRFSTCNGSKVYRFGFESNWRTYSPIPPAIEYYSNGPDYAPTCVSFNPGTAPNNWLLKDYLVDSNSVSEISCGYSSHCSHFYPDYDTNALPTGIARPKVEANELALYPNPTSGKVLMSMQEGNGGTIKIIDMKGALLLTEQLGKGATSLTLDLSYLPNGLYTFLYTDRDGMIKPSKFEIMR